MDYKAYIQKFIEWIKGSADNTPGGASSKKLTGFWLIVFVATPPMHIWMWWALAHGDWSLLPIVLPIVLTAGLTALGINAYEKKNGVADNSTEKK
ncbi:MAG: hypothetical protein EPO45_20330 [Sphingobium sp.]|nr:MAG: hypothetical protein EPO45_20330 [Sphingobium sp.]